MTNKPTSDPSKVSRLVFDPLPPPRISSTSCTSSSASSLKAKVAKTASSAISSATVSSIEEIPFPETLFNPVAIEILDKEHFSEMWDHYFNPNVKEEMGRGDKLFAHLHGDSVISGSSAQGYDREGMAEFLVQYLESYQNPLLAQALERIKGLTVDWKNGLNIKERVRELRPQESLLVHGGWAGFPGHAMIYEFVKKANGNYDFYVYNTGAGTSYHLLFFEDRGKLRINPVLLYADVLPEEFGIGPKGTLLDSPLFFSLLFEIVYSTERPAHLQVDEFYIYEVLFKHIQYKKKIPDTPHFMQAQRAGTCAWKVLLPLVQATIDDEDVFKRWKFDLKLRSLLAYYKNKIQGHEDVPDSTLLLFEVAVSKLQRKIVKLAAKGLIKEEELAKLASALTIMKDKGNEIREKWKAHFKSLNVEMQTAQTLVPLETNTDLARGGITKIASFVKSSDPSANIVKPPRIFYRSPGPPPANPSHFLHWLIDVRNLFEALRFDHPKAALFKWESVCYSLPLDPENRYWDEIPESDILHTLELLTSLTEEYAALIVCSKSHLLPRQMNTAGAALVAAYRLAIRKEKEFFGNNGILLSHFPSLKAFSQAFSSPYLVFYHTEDFAKRQEILAWEQNNVSSLFEVFYETTINPDENSPYYHVEWSILCQWQDKPELFEITQKTLSLMESEFQKENVSFTKKRNLEKVLIVTKPEVFRRAPQPFVEHYLALRRIAFLVPLLSGSVPLRDAPRQDTVNLFADSWTSLFHHRPVLQIGFFWKKNYTSIDWKMPDYRFERWRNYFRFFDPLSKAYRREKLKTLEEWSNDHNESLTCRKKSCLLTESNFYAHPDSNVSKIGSLPLDVTQCEPQLVPFKVLSYFSDRLSELEDPDNQTLFDILFFKPFLNDFNEENMYLFSELRENHKLVRQCELFIEEGLSHCLLRRGTNAFKIHAALFFIRFAERIRGLINLSEVSEESPFHTSRKTLNQWLKSPEKFSAEDLTSIHLHRLFSLNFSLPDFNSNLEEAVKEAIVSWIYICTHSIDPNWRDPGFRDLVETQFYRHSEMIAKVSGIETNEVLGLALQTSGLIGPLEVPPTDFTGTFPYYFSQSSGWGIDILSGSVKYRNENSSVPDHSGIEGTPSYKRIFGEKRFIFQPRGTWIYFEDSEKRQRFRVNYKQVNHVYIFQQLIKNSWHQYLNPSDVEGLLPLPLVADHLHWMPIDTKDCILICDQKEGTPLYRYDPEEIVHLPTQERISLFDPNHSFSLFNIELPGAIFQHVSPSGSSRITLPRFVSLAKKPLEFVQAGTQYYWSGNKKYALILNEEAGRIGFIPNGVALQDSTGTQKLLVPMLPIQKRKNFERAAKIDVLDGHRSKEYQNRSDWNPPPQQGVYQYLEFNLESEGPVPLNLEGRWYLAYLFLAQREYEDAARLLRQIPQAANLSQECVKIAIWLVEEGTLGTDHSAPAAACRLIAASILGNHFSRTKENFFSEYPRNFIRNDWEIYHGSINNVPASLRLSLSEQNFLHEFVVLPQKNTTSPQEIDLTERPNLPNERRIPFLFLDAPLRDSGNNRNSLNAREDFLFMGFNFEEDDAPLPQMNLSVTSRLSIGNYFGYYYAQLKRASPIERIALAFQLNMAYALGFIGGSGSFTVEAVLELLHFVLKYPESAPELPNLSASTKNWLATLLNAYQLAENKEKEVSAKQRCDLFQSRFPIKKALPERLSSIQERLLPSSASSLSAPFQLLKLNQELLSPARLQDLIADYFQVKEEDAQGQVVKKWEVPASLEPEILKAVEDFISDCEIGLKQNSSQSTFQFKAPFSLDVLGTALQEKLEAQQKICRDYERKIKEKTKRLHSSLLSGFTHHLLVSSGFAPTIDLEFLIQAFGVQDPSLVMARNSALTPDDVEQIFQNVQLYLVHQLECQQIKRAQKLLDTCQGLLETEDAEAFAVTSDLLAKTLNETMQYLPDEEPLMLVFEYKANFRIRKEQIHLLAKMSELDHSSHLFRDIVVGLMMGGGKTTVLASLLLRKAATGKRLPIFVPPAAQFRSLAQNLATSQKNTFQQELFVLDFNRTDMSAEGLKKIRLGLQEAIQNRKILLIKSDKIEAFSLEYLSTLYEIKQRGLQTEEHTEKLQELKIILSILESTSDVLIDEVDIILDVNHSTNFPIGQPQKLKTFYVQLLQLIYSYHVAEDLLISDGRSVSEVIRLTENLQHLLDIEFYKKEVQPVIVGKMFDSHFPLFRLGGQYKESFVRFVTDQIKKQELPPCQNVDAKDHLFLVELERMFSQGTLAEKNAAELICMFKYFMTSILPLALGKSTGKHYGRNPKGNTCEIIPYHAVGSPASTKFGNPWEAAAYHFQAACKGVTEHHIERYVNLLRRRIELAIKKGATSDLLAEELRKFEKITGIPFEDWNTPGALERALKFIHHNPKQALHLEAEIIEDIVEWHPHFLSSNSQNLTAKLSTLRTFSGTPWNIATYSKRLQGNVELEQGVIGRIAEKMREREKLQKPHIVLNTHIRSVLKQVQENSKRWSQIFGLIDAGGIFKDYSNLELAKEILDYFVFTNDERIQSVLFFGRAHADELSPDHLMVLKKGDSSPTYIGKTSLEALTQAGVDPSSMFVYYDERHCEATDIAQKSSAINLLTADRNTIIRAFSQGALRLRKYLLSQDIEFVITAAAQKTLLNQGQSISDILLSSVRAQALKLAKDTYRAFRNKILACIQEALFKEIRNDNNPAKLFSQYEQFFVHHQECRPYAQYAPLHQAIPSGQSLKSYADALFKNLRSCTQNNEIVEQIEKMLHEILQEVEQSPHLPATVPESISDSEEMEIHNQAQVFVEEEQEINQEIQQEINQEVLKELSQYKNETRHPPYTEKDWTKELLLSQNFPANPEIWNLNDLLEAHSAKVFDYHTIFDGNIFISKNLALTYTEYVPVFCSSQKPAEQFLAVLKEDGSMQFVLLSIQDANTVKLILRQGDIKHMWLLLANGQEISPHFHPETQEIRALVERALIQVNLFNGNAAYFELHKQAASQFFFKDGETDLKLRFLQLKALSDPCKKDCYQRSFLLRFEERESALSAGAHPTYSTHQIQQIDPSAVRFLSGPEIRHLQTKAQLQALPDEMLSRVTPQQIAADLLAEKQIQKLIFPAQLASIPKERLPSLTATQIKRFPAEHLNRLPIEKLTDLGIEHLRFLSNDQWNLIVQKVESHVANYEWLIKNVPGSKIHLIPDSLLYLTFTNQEAVASLATNRLYLLPGTSICYCTAAQVPFLTDAQLNAVPIEHLALLNNNQISRLTNPASLQFLPPERLVHCTPAQVPLLRQDQYRHLTDAQLNAVPIGCLGWLTAGQISRLTNPERLQALPPERLVHCTPAQIPLLSQDQYQHLTTDAQLNAVPIGRLSWLTAGQISRLTNPERLQALTANELIHCTPAQISSLADAQLRFLVIPDQIQNLPPERVHYLDPAQYRHLRTLNQLERVSDEHYTHLTKDQLQRKYGGTLASIKLATIGIFAYLARVIFCFAYFLPAFRNQCNWINSRCRFLHIAVRMHTA